MINKTVLIKVIAFLCGNIQDPGGLNLAILIAVNKLSIHAQMPHAVCRDLPGQSHRHHLFLGGHKTPGLVDDVVNGIDSFLNGADPSLIHHFMENPVFLLQGIITGLHHLKKVLKIPIALQALSDTLRIFQI